MRLRYKCHNKRSSFQSYFSLLELMIVLIIMVMLAGLALPPFMDKLKKAKVKSTKVQIETLKGCLKDYYLDMNEYPSSGEGLEALIKNPGNDSWDGPYLDRKSIPKDAWGNNFQYESPGQNDDFDISSYGADGSPGGEKYNKDITSWDE